MVDFEPTSPEYILFALDMERRYEDPAWVLDEVNAELSQLSAELTPAIVEDWEAHLLHIVSLWEKDNRLLNM